MAELFYYRKHHERQAEIQKEAYPDDKGICDLRRSLTQQIFFRAFYDTFIKGYEITTKKFNGRNKYDRKLDAKIESYFVKIYPEVILDVGVNYWDSPNWAFRQMARDIFVAGFECTDKNLNNEVTPKALMIDTRANPCVLLDKYEQAIMWIIGIHSKEDIGLKDCPEYLKLKQ